MSFHVSLGECTNLKHRTSGGGGGSDHLSCCRGGSGSSRVVPFLHVDSELPATNTTNQDCCPRRDDFSSHLAGHTSNRSKT